MIRLGLGILIAVLLIVVLGSRAFMIKSTATWGATDLFPAGADKARPSTRVRLGIP